MQTHIQTERLLLRPLRPSDAAVVVDPLNNWSVVQYLSSIPQPYAIDDAVGFISNIAVPGQYWAIEDADGLVGVISATNEMGYWLMPHAWGKGYVTEAGDAVIDARFQDGDIDVIYAGFHPDNTVSGNALRKMGFTGNGTKTSYFIPLACDIEMTYLKLTRARWEERRHFRVITPRLHLREYQPEDYIFSYEMCRHANVARMTSSIPHPWTMAAAREWSLKCTYVGRPNFTAIIILPNGLPIGAIGMGRKTSADRCNLGYMMHPDFWGQGFMSEAVDAFCRECFARFDIDMLEAGHFHDNPASGRILQKTGFVYESTSASPSASRVEDEDILLYRLDRSLLES